MVKLDATMVVNLDIELLTRHFTDILDLILKLSKILEADVTSVRRKCDVELPLVFVLIGC